MALVMSCHEIWREISNYLDGDIDPALKARMERHFANCRHCSVLLDSTHNLLVLTGDGRSFALPAGFSLRLRQRLAQHIAGPRRSDES